MGKNAFYPVNTLLNRCDAAQPMTGGMTMRKLLLIALLSAALAGCGQGEPAASQADASSQLPAASSQAASEPVVLEPVAPDVSSAVSSQPGTSSSVVTMKKKMALYAA